MFTLIDVTPDVTDTYKYKFNGMEWQDEFDVNLYDFGARNYDPALVRTFTPDPMAENFYSLVPYSFLNNNPLNTIDPTGALSITLTGQDAKDFFQGLKDDIASKPKNYEDEMDNGIDGSGGGGNVANPNNPIQLDEIIIDNNNSGNFNINLQDRYAGSMNQWQEKTGGKFSSDHALADLQWYISYGNADQEYFQAQLDAQTSAQHKATNNAAELLSYILPTPLAGGAVIGKAPALYKSAKYSKIMYRPLSKANKGYFNFQIGIRNTKTNYHLRLERHQFNTNKGSKIHATHINYGKGGEKHWFLNRVKRSNIKL